MPILQTLNQDFPECSTAVWSISDLDRLTEVIAYLALTLSDHATRVLSGQTEITPFVDDELVAAASKLVIANNDGDKYHRDGWLFQMISWVALKCEDPEAMIAPPHSRWTDKGLDCLLMKMANDSIEYIVITEDKATDNPRDVIRDEVFPSFKRFESGAGKTDIVPVVAALLRSRQADPTTAMSGPSWYGEQRYRVAVTASKAKYASDRKRRDLFKDYDLNVLGHVRKRNSGLFLSSDARGFLASLAERILTVLPTLKSENVRQ